PGHAHERHQLAALDSQADALEHRHVQLTKMIGLVNVFEFNQCHRSKSSHRASGACERPGAEPGSLLTRSPKLLLSFITEHLRCKRVGRAAAGTIFVAFYDEYCGPFFQISPGNFSHSAVVEADADLDRPDKFAIFNPDPAVFLAILRLCLWLSARSAA